MNCNTHTSTRGSHKSGIFFFAPAPLGNWALGRPPLWMQKGGRERETGVTTLSFQEKNKERLCKKFGIRLCCHMYGKSHWKSYNEATYRSEDLKLAPNNNTYNNPDHSYRLEFRRWKSRPPFIMVALWHGERWNCCPHPPSHIWKGENSWWW